MQRTRIKFCGLSRIDDVQHAVALGVDAIGLVFYPPSPRSVTIAQADKLARCIPPFIAIVGLFVNADVQAIRRVMDAVPLTMLQFHGDETPAQCQTLAASLQRQWIRAIGVTSSATSEDLMTSASDYAAAAASGLLFDTAVAGYGGGGKTFDWSKIPDALMHRIILSGGLNPQNVGDAIARIRPYAVDVSSGIEPPGIKDIKGIKVKDPTKMAAFVKAVRTVDATERAAPAVYRR